MLGEVSIDNCFERLHDKGNSVMPNHRLGMGRLENWIQLDMRSSEVS